MRYSRSNKTTTGSLRETQTKTAKIDYFTKNLSSPRFFEINTQTFMKCSLIFLKNSVKRNFEKNNMK